MDGVETVPCEACGSRHHSIGLCKAHLCQACRDRSIEVKAKSLCRACSMAIWRRIGRGESWDEALADRQRQVARGRRGLVSGQGVRGAAR